MAGLSSNVVKAGLVGDTNVLYVSPDGNNLTAQKGNKYKPWADVWTAVDLASNDEMVYVFAGVYDIGVQANRNLAKDGVRIHFERVYFEPITGNPTNSLFIISGAGSQYVSGELCFWSDFPEIFMVSTEGAEGYELSIEAYESGHVAIGANECWVRVNGVIASDTNTPENQTGPNIGIVRDRDYTATGSGIPIIQYDADFFIGRFVNWCQSTPNVVCQVSIQSGRLKTENDGIPALWAAQTFRNYNNCKLSVSFQEVRVIADTNNMGLIPMDGENSFENEYSLNVGNMYIERGALVRPRTSSVRTGVDNKFSINIGSLVNFSGQAVIPDIHLETGNIFQLHIGNCIQDNFSGPIINVPGPQIQAGTTLIISGNYVQEDAGQPTINVAAAVGDVIIRASGQGGTGLVGSANCAAVLYQDGTGTTVI